MPACVAPALAAQPRRAPQQPSAPYRTPCSCSLPRALAGVALAAALLAASPVHAEARGRAAVVPKEGSVELQGPARVVDGDTLVLNGAQRVRLYGVDAPESKQTCRLADGSDWACGQASADALRAKVAAAGGAAHCVVLNADRYGRNVALCDAGGDDIATWLVSRGWALAYRQYGGTAFAGEEATAKDARAGVWAAESFTPPWQWRAEQRAAQQKITSG